MPDGIGIAIDGWVDRHCEDLLRLVRALVQIPTENAPPKGDELAGQRYVKGLLEGMGAEVDFFFLDEVEGLKEHPAYWPGRDYADRPNVVGRFRGTGGGRSLCFSSHIDTAPRTPLPWSESSPFSGEVKEGRIYGRGAYDMKGGLAASIIAVKALKELGWRLYGDVLIESVVDEEWGGSNGTLASRLRGHAADVAIIPEPSHMMVCPGHLGVRIYRITLGGLGGMRFGGENLVNPIVAMASVIDAFQGFALKRQSAPMPALYGGSGPPPIDIMRIHGEGYGVPRECSLDFYVHCVEGETEASLDAAVAEFVGALGASGALSGQSVSVRPLGRFLPPSSIPTDHPIVACAQRALGEIPNRDVIVRGAPFACDAFVFNRYDFMPALVLGPGGARAHAQDECANVDDLVDLVKVYARMMVDWCKLDES